MLFVSNSATVPALIAALVVLIALRALRPKRFYIIRHGETLLNAEHIRQGADGLLSPKGSAQATQVGNALVGLSIRRIFTSTYPRARETADIIAGILHARVFPSALLEERRNPSEIIGKSTHDPEVARIVDQVDLSYHDDTYRFSDEENFDDLKKRARACLNLLARRGASATVVVTHHLMLKMIVAYALYHEQLHASDFAKLTFFNASDNGGITILEYNPLHAFSKTRGWSVMSYNQHAQ